MKIVSLNGKYKRPASKSRVSKYTPFLSEFNTLEAGQGSLREFDTAEEAGKFFRGAAVQLRRNRAANSNHWNSAVLYQPSETQVLIGRKVVESEEVVDPGDVLIGAEAPTLLPN